LINKGGGAIILLHPIPLNLTVVVITMKKIWAGMIEKMIARAHKYCDMLINDDPLLKGSINNIKNVKDSEGIDEKEEDEDENDDINIEADEKIL